MSKKSETWEHPLSISSTCWAPTLLGSFMIHAWLVICLSHARASQGIGAFSNLNTCWITLPVERPHPISNEINEGSGPIPNASRRAEIQPAPQWLHWFNAPSGRFPYKFVVHLRQKLVWSIFYWKMVRWGWLRKQENTFNNLKYNITPIRKGIYDKSKKKKQSIRSGKLGLVRKTCIRLLI